MSKEERAIEGLHCIVRQLADWQVKYSKKGDNCDMVSFAATILCGAYEMLKLEIESNAPKQN